MSFAEVIGQDRPKELVSAWLTSGRLPHAILITGPAGTGKRRFALELVKAILCREEGTDACDRCVSCHKVDLLLHPDLHLLMPMPSRRGKQDDASLREEMRSATADYLRYEQAPFLSSANIARDHLRLLQREMSYAPVEATRKIGVILDADCMHPAGANSLLKILEEPPGNALFILVSAAPERMLSTILSRCQRLSLQRLSRAAVREYLRDSSLEPERRELAVRLGGGNLQRAIQVGQGELDELRELVEGFLTAGVERRDQGYWSLLDELGARRERGQLEPFLEMCGVYLRDLFLLAYGRGEEIALVDRRPYLESLQNRLSVDQIAAAAEEIDRAFDYLARNVNAQLLLADLWHCLRRARTGAL